MRPAKGKQGSTHLFSNLFHSYKSGVWGALPLALANFFGPSVKLSLALSKGLCHKQPIETKQTKEITIPWNYRLYLETSAQGVALDALFMRPYLLTTTTTTANQT